MKSVALVEAKAPDQLVRQAGLAGAAGSGDAEHRRFDVVRCGAQLGA
jgi:hypothetical protein